MYFLKTLQVCAPCHGGVLYSALFHVFFTFYANSGGGGGVDQKKNKKKTILFHFAILCYFHHKKIYLEILKSAPSLIG